MEGPVPVSAFVDDRSEAGITAVELHWRHDGGPWNVEPMMPAGADLYESAIPSPTVPTASTVVADYFIHAADASGRTAGVPRPEPNAWFSFPIVVPTGAPVVAGVEAKAPFPNPSRAGTTFQFSLKFPERVDLAVYDVRGRLVHRLLADEMSEGLHRVDWNGRDQNGAAVPAGTYFFRLRAAGIAYSRPVTIVR